MSELRLSEYLERSMTYAAYLGLIDNGILQKRSTGPNTSPALLEYTKLNRRRMERLEKTLVPDLNAIAKVSLLRTPMTWLTITEGWCGDAAQNIPVIELLAAANPRIETRYILRDENLELMDAFLTRGARSIPKLIAVSPHDGTVIGTWGPRPEGAQALYDEMHSRQVPKSEIMTSLQHWYNADRGASVQDEIAELARRWERTELSRTSVAA